MAFKNGVEQKVEIGANADQALGVINQLAKQVGSIFDEILKKQVEITRGTHKQEDATRKLIQTLQRQLGELNTINSAYDQIANKGRSQLISGLSDQKVGKQVVEASRLARSLQDAGTAAEAFGTRYTKAIEKASKAQGALTKSEQREIEALLASQKQLQRIQGQIDRFDVKAQSKGGYSPSEFAERGKLQAQLNELNRRARDENVSATAYAGQIKAIQSMAVGLGQVATLERQRSAELARQEAAYNKLAEQKRKLRKADDQAALAQLKLQDRLGQQRDRLEARVLKESRRREQQASNLLIPGDVRDLAARSGSARDARSILARDLLEAEKRLADAKGRTKQAELDAVRTARARLDAATRLARLEDQAAAKAAAQLRRNRALDTRVGMATARADVTSLIGQTGSSTIAIQALEKNAAQALRDVRRAGDEEAKKAALEQLRLAQKQLDIARQIAKEQGKSAGDARARALKLVNLEDAQLRAMATRGSGGFRFTEQDARGFDMKRVNAEYDAAFARLQRIRDLSTKAFAAPGGPTNERLRVLQQEYDKVAAAIARAEAQKKAFDKLPEQQAARSRQNIMNQIFGDGGLAFGARIAGIAAISSVAYGALNAVGASGRAVVELEDQLAKLQAISGTTDGEMQKLASSIIEVGNSSRYSTMEIAQGATTIAQAGFAAAETREVLKSALDLASASGSTPTESIDLMTSALGAFNLQASESAVVADTVAAALNETKLSVEQMRLAIQYVGATAKENNVSLMELAAISGSLANAGIRSGSTIGTGLRQLLVDLKTPTGEFKRELESLGLTLADVDVKSLGVAKVVKNLSDAGFSAEQAYASFEVRAASSFLALRNQIDSYDDLYLSLQQTGAAARAAAEANSSLTAKYQTLKNNLLEFATLAAQPVVDILKTLTDVATGVTSGINDFVGAVFGATDGTTRWGAIIQSSLTPALIGLAVSGGNPLGALIGGLLGATSSLLQLDTATNKYSQTANEARSELDKQNQVISSLDTAKQSLLDRESQLIDGSAALQAETLTLSERFEGLADKVDWTKLSYEGLLKAMSEVTEETLRLQQANAEKVAFESGREADEYRRNALSKQRNVSLLAGNEGGMFVPFEDNKDIRDGLRRLENADISKVETRTLIQSLLNKMGKEDPRGLKTGRRAEAERELQRMLEGFLEQTIYYQASSAEVRQAERTSNRVDAYFNTGGSLSTRKLTEISRTANAGERANKERAGSGNVQLNSALAEANKELARIEALIAKAGQGSDERAVLETQLSEVKATISNINRALRPEEERGGGNSAPGGILDANGVGAMLRQDFGVEVNSTTRTRKEQERLWAAYQNGGNLAAKPGTSPHEHGRAVDITPPRGVSPAQLKKYMEDKGFTGVRILHPGNSNYKSHWHVQWASQNSTGAQAISQAETQKAQQEARELQQLLEFEARSKVGEVDARIETLTTNARTGTIRPLDVLNNFDKLAEERRVAKLNEFDVSRPTTGLGASALKQRGLARAQLEKELVAEQEALLAKVWRGIADAALGAYDTAIEMIDLKAQQGQFAAEDDFDQVLSVGRTRENRYNRANYDVGTRFLQEEREFEAGITRDQALVQVKATEIAGRRAEIEKLRAELSELTEGSELYLEVEKKIAAAQQELNTIDRERIEILRSLEERTARAAELPLTERLAGAARAWQESSGALNSIGTNLANGVGPMLDNLSNGFTDFFSSVMNGTKGFKTALGDMLRSFIGFVQEMIIRAIALQVVSMILNSVAPGSGTAVAAGASGFGKAIGGAIPRFNGGPTGDAPGLYGGGRVSAPSPFRDSKLYNLADGEFVVRNKSVKDLGLPFMDAINKHGRAGAAKMMGAGRALMNIQQPKQETNVFVVAEKQEAGMGPNDVLVTIHRDILQNGATKRLIKQVAQGG